MKIVDPVYAGDRSLEPPNYGAGWIGFSRRTEWWNILSPGIAFFTREEYEDLVPSHAFIVKDRNTIIEAIWPTVCELPIEKYFKHPNTLVFFRKPRDLTPLDAQQIVFNAVMRLGQKFEFDLFGYFMFRWLMRRLGRLEPFKKKPALLNSPKEWICSELAAECLKEIPKYSNLLPLSEYHTSKIDPLMLFRSEIFEEWEFDD